MFGSCLHVVEQILPRFGISHTLVDGGDVGAWEKAMRPQTKMLFLETPSNPDAVASSTSKAVAKIADRHGALLVVDNAFATPGAAAADGVRRPYRGAFLHQIYRRPGPRAGRRDPVQAGNSSTIICRSSCATPGPRISPFNAWLHLKSLETLDLRMRAHCENAAQGRRFPGRAQSKVTRVLYPFRPDHPQHNLARAQMEGGGGVVTFEVEGGKTGGVQAAPMRWSLIDISNNLGDAKSLITHPATTTHQKLTPEARAGLGVNAGLLRLSVGLEDADDLCEDLEQALKVA